MSWRVALIDSCGHWPGAADAAAFVSDGQRVERRETAADSSGHGSRIARLFTADDVEIHLLLAQVMLGERAASAALAAAVDWAAEQHAELIHMSLGLKADRDVLAAAVAHAVAAGCIIVASTPARGALVYPAGYANVIRATGDARCAPGEVSSLDPWLFGGCPRFSTSGDPSVGMRSAIGTGGGASAGAAQVTRTIITGPKRESAAAVAAALTASARYRGRERRGSVPAA